jgi:hypothetical protein
MEEFLSLQKLYHFTKFDTALKIIKSGKLKFNVLSKMNDALEMDKHIYNLIIDIDKDRLIDTNDIKKEIYNYEQISLTEDKRRFGSYGFELHQLWGHYAENTTGVCFVFDRERLIETLSDSKENNFHGAVTYVENFTQDQFTNVPNNDEIKVWVKENAQRLFFTKRKEWEHEQEYRIIQRFREHDSFHGIDIRNSMRYAILFNPETSKIHDCIEDCLEYKILKSLLPLNVHILSYECFAGEYQLIGNFRETVWTESGRLSIEEGDKIDV